MSNTDKYPNLPKSPIEVAIFEIRHHFINPPISIAGLSGFHSFIKEKYPISNLGYNRNVQIDELPNGKPKVKIISNDITEIRFISSDKRMILMIRPNVFNLNIPGNYTNWNDCFSEFQYLWEQFKKYLLSIEQTFEIIGASVRYINKFKFETFDNPSEYFNTTIYAVQDAIPDEVTSYLMRYVTQRNNIQINVTQGLEPIIGNEIPYLVDMDIIYNSGIPNDNIWEIYDELHAVKNEVFFSNLTEKTLNLLS